MVCNTAVAAATDVSAMAVERIAVLTVARCDTAVLVWLFVELNDAPFATDVGKTTGPDVD